MTINGLRCLAQVCRVVLIVAAGVNIAILCLILQPPTAKQSAFLHRYMEANRPRGIDGLDPIAQTDAHRKCLFLGPIEENKKCMKMYNVSNHKHNRRCNNSDIRNWSDVQGCLNGRKQNSYGAKRIHLIGERHSGTNWVLEELKNCFAVNNESKLQVSPGFAKPKHMFQTELFDPSLTHHYVIAIFRDPFDWVAAMIEKPYHMPDHFKGFDGNYNPIPLYWEDFVTRPLTMPNRTEIDWSYISNNKTKQAVCKFGFEFHEIAPCRRADVFLNTVGNSYEPLYELRRELRHDVRGVPFDNIMQLRSEKIRNFLFEVPKMRRVEGYLAIRYEDLVRNGTQPMLAQVAEMLGLRRLPRNCTPHIAQPQKLGKRRIPQGLRQWISQHLDAQTERLLGYK